MSANKEVTHSLKQKKNKMEQEKIDYAKCLSDLATAFDNMSDTVGKAFETLATELRKKEEENDTELLSELLLDHKLVQSLAIMVTICNESKHSFKFQRIIDNIDNDKIFNYLSLSKYCKVIGLRPERFKLSLGCEGVKFTVTDPVKYEGFRLEFNYNYHFGNEFTLFDVFDYNANILKGKLWTERDLLGLMPLSFRLACFDDELINQFISIVRKDNRFVAITRVPVYTGCKVEIAYDFQ